MDKYTEILKNTIGKIKIVVNSHDNCASKESYVIKITLLDIPKNLMRNKGQLALDASNYLYRCGLKFRHMPEYHHKGFKNNSLTFFMNHEDVFNSLNGDFAKLYLNASDRMVKERYLAVSTIYNMVIANG